MVEGRFGGMDLLIEELPADLVLPGQRGDRSRPGEHPYGQVSPLLRPQSLGGTRSIRGYRRGPAQANAEGRGEIGLRDRGVRSSLANHVCFLRETGSCGSITRSMEETGILEKANLSAFCDLALNQVPFLAFAPAARIAATDRAHFPH